MGCQHDTMTSDPGGRGQTHSLCSFWNLAKLGLLSAALEDLEPLLGRIFYDEREQGRKGTEDNELLS